MKVWFHDHHDQTIEKDDSEVPRCVNVAVGEVVYEDENWIRLRHAINDLDGDAEEWEIHAVLKKDIIRIEEGWD
jgi:hypothetical protein